MVVSDETQFRVFAVALIVACIEVQDNNICHHMCSCSHFGPCKVTVGCWYSQIHFALCPVCVGDAM